MKTVKAKNRFKTNYRKQVPITINPDFSQNVSNRILFFTSLEPALILMSFATILDKTVEKIAYLGGIFSKLRSRPILPFPRPPGSNVAGSSKESRIPKHL